MPTKSCIRYWSYKQGWRWFFVIPDVGGPENSYLVVINPSDWASCFEDWLDEPIDLDELTACSEAEEGSDMEDEGSNEDEETSEDEDEETSEEEESEDEDDE